MSARRAFSLVELLVVVGIILVLAALLLPVFVRAKTSASIADCETRLHQVGLGIALYQADYDGQTWLEYHAIGSIYSTAGPFRYPWDNWLPLAPYLRTDRIIWCPQPSRDPSEGSTTSLYSFRKIALPQDNPIGGVTTYHLFDPTPGGVVAICSNHTTSALEQPNPVNSMFAALYKGIYPVVRDDGSASVVKSSQISLEYLWQDGTWHLKEQGSTPSYQEWRFPGEIWPNSP